MAGQLASHSHPVDNWSNSALAAALKTSIGTNTRKPHEAARQTPITKPKTRSTLFHHLQETKCRRMALLGRHRWTTRKGHPTYITQDVIRVTIADLGRKAG